MLNIDLKPLGRVRNMIQAVSLDISYAYDDLVFVEPNAFLIRFDLKDPSKIYIHFNVDCEEGEATRLLKALSQLATKEGLILVEECKYDMSSNEETEEIELRFVEGYYVD